MSGSLLDNTVLRPGTGIPGAKLSLVQPLATTAASVSANIATFTMASNPVTAGFVAGMKLLVAGFTGGDTFFNAGSLSNNAIINGYTILSVTTTTVSVALVHASASATSNGTLLQMGDSTHSAAGLVTIYTDASLTTTQANPFTSDTLGNYDVGVAPGIYYLQIYGDGITTQLREVVVADIGASVVAGGSNTDVQYNNNGTLAGDSGFTYNSTTKIVSAPAGFLFSPTLTTAPLLTVTPTGTTGATTYIYSVYGRKGTLSIGDSSEVTITNGNATLNGTNYNALSWTAQTGADSYDIYRITSGGTPNTTGLIANTTSTSFHDTGIAITSIILPTEDGANAPRSSNGYVGIETGLQIGPALNTFPTYGTGFWDVFPDSIGDQGTLVVNSLPVVGVSDGDAIGIVVHATTSASVSGQGSTAYGLFVNSAVTDNAAHTNGAQGIICQTLFNNPSGTHDGSMNALQILTDDIGAGSWTASGDVCQGGIITRMAFGMTGTTAQIQAHTSEFNNYTTGTITNLFHFIANEQDNAGGGTITNAYGFATNVSLANATNSYAFYSADQGTTANHWAIYTAGQTPSQYGGNATWQNPIAATSLANQVAPVLTLGGTYWNGAASATDTWLFISGPGTGTNPSSTLQINHAGSSGGGNIQTNGGFTAGGNLEAGGEVGAGNGVKSYGNTPATNIANFTFGPVTVAGNYWTGAASAQDSWTETLTLGTGTNPTSTFTIAHTGSSGVATLVLPNTQATTLTVTAATPTSTSGQVGFGTTAGFGNGTPATPVTTTTKSTGTGPTTPQTVVNYLEIDIAGTKYWIPLVQ